MLSVLPVGEIYSLAPDFLKTLQKYLKALTSAVTVPEWNQAFKNSFEWQTFRDAGNARPVL